MSNIIINKLFGQYDHSVNISNRCTILIGENGTGKTTILRIIYALIRFDFVELSKYRFESISIISEDDEIEIKYADLLPDFREILKKNVSFEKEDYHEFYTSFISSCYRLIKPNHFSWIMACIYHKYPVDPADIHTLDKAMKLAYKESQISYDSGCKINVFDFIRNQIFVNTIEYQKMADPNMNMQFITGSKYELLFNKQDITDFNITARQSEGFDVLKIVANRLSDDISNLVLCQDCIEFIAKYMSALEMENCIYVDMTDQLAFRNEPTCITPTHPIIDELRKLESDDSIILKKDNNYDAYRREKSKLATNLYMEFLETYSRWNDEDLFHEFQGEKRDCSDIILESIAKNRTIDINSIIRKLFFTGIEPLEINTELLNRYIKAMREGCDIGSSSIDKNMELTLYDFFFSKYAELKDWFGPIVIKNSVFDFDFDKLKFPFQYSPQNEELILYTKHGLIQLDNKPIDKPFVLAHKIFYEFYENDFEKYKHTKNENMCNFVEILSKFLFNKRILCCPAGIKFYNINGVEIDPNHLSSGERKILGLLVVAFFTDDVTLLIDEPELSISVVWQSILLPIILNKTELKKIIIATHSPFIVEDEDLLQYLHSLN